MSFQKQVNKLLYKLNVNKIPVSILVEHLDIVPDFKACVYMCENDNIIVLSP
jgi:hypothetical protein